jgi:HAD superfamily hydrolase (TIGR01509 family)
MPQQTRTSTRRTASANTAKRRHVPKRSPSGNVPPFLLDIDGTLLDAVYEHVISWRKALAHRNIYLPNWKIHRRMGMSGSVFLPTLLRELGEQTDKAEIKQLENIRSEIFMGMIDEVRVLPGANDFLQSLDRTGARWAIASTGDRKQVEKLLKKLDVPEGIPVITGDDVATAKPAPDCFVAAADRLGVPKSEAIIVGDSPWDLLAAKRMKALGIGLLSGGYAECELERAGAYWVYEDPADLLSHLEELGIHTE